MKPILIFRIIVYLIVFSSYGLLFLGESKVIWLTQEDGLIENIGALFFLLASGLFILAYYRSRWQGNGNHVIHFQIRRNVFYLLLGILFLIAFGEEISWGQRIFDWQTPPLLNEINAQKETNIHNIWILNGRLPGEQHKSIYGINLNMNAYFSVFWFLFCVVVPIMDKVSTRAHSFLSYFRLPICKLWIGGLFLSHAIIFHIIFNFLPYSLPGRIDELREANYAFMFFIFAWHEYACVQQKEFQ